MSIYANNINSIRYELLSEAYIGKTPILLEIEKQIGIIRAEAAKKYTDINKSVQVQKLNRLFEQQFGMDVFALHIEQNNTINAYTIPVARNFDIAFNEVLARKVTGDKVNGYRFAEKNNLCIICNVYLGLIKSPEITDAELLSVILHELGHNFADAISKDIEIANKNFAKAYIGLIIINAICTLGLSLFIDIPTVLKNTNKIKKKSESKKKKHPIKGLLKGISATCNDIGDVISGVLRRLDFLSNALFRANKRAAEISGSDKAVKRSVGRQNEVIADRFAGIYGYGPEQASVLIKMDKKVGKAERIVDKIPVIGKIANKSFNELMQDIYKFDSHPHTIQRANDQLKILKDELEKSDLDPKLKKTIEAQIKELEKIIKEATTIIEDMPEDQARRTQIYKKVLEEDPESLDKEIEERISRAFDDLLEENDK